MVLYVCPRCQYSSKLRNDLRRHFKRKKPCKVLFKDIDIPTRVRMVLDEEYTCKKARKKNKPAVITNVPDIIVSKQTMYTQSHSSSDSSIDEDYYECKYCMIECLIIDKLDIDISLNVLINLNIIFLIKEEVAQKLAEKDILINELRNQIGTLLEKVGDTYNTNTFNIVINPFWKRKYKLYYIRLC